MAHPPLTVRQRSCLLRAARRRLTELHDEYDALQGMLDISGKADLVFTEIGCVTQGVKWLWTQRAIDDVPPRAPRGAVPVNPKHDGDGK